MSKRSLIVFMIFLGLVLTGAVSAAAQQQSERTAISGHLVQGYRILTIKGNDQKIILNVYRGDYIKFDFDLAIQNPVLEIPDLSVRQRLSSKLDAAPHFKMKKAGRFQFMLGGISGHIRVIEYKQAFYREVDAEEAAQILKNQKPTLLDVRTRREFNRGHIPESKLIPVQELQKRLGELAAYKHADIVIYCASGNRSTVASKILIDNGFKRIINMRYGIAQWSRNKHPVTK